MSNENVEIKNEEQWLSDGICRFCRKVNYCGTMCGPRKRKRKAFKKGLEYALKKSKLKNQIVLLSGKKEENKADE